MFLLFTLGIIHIFSWKKLCFWIKSECYKKPLHYFSILHQKLIFRNRQHNFWTKYDLKKWRRIQQYLFTHENIFDFTINNSFFFFLFHQVICSTPVEKRTLLTPSVMLDVLFLSFSIFFPTSSEESLEDFPEFPRFHRNPQRNRVRDVLNRYAYANTDVANSFRKDGIHDFFKTIG